MRGTFFAGVLLALALAAPARGAQDAAPAASVTIDTVVVTGAQPGPRLWKVSRGDHVLWILGTLSPLPKDMEWASGQAAARIREAQEILKPPSARIDSDLGFFGALTLLPSAMSARKNPDGKTLQQVLPAPVYARWLVLKQRYIGRDNGVEKFRPVFAANELWEAAIKRSGLSQGNVVWPVIDDIADEVDAKVTSPTITIKLEDPRKALKEFKGTALNDVACFERTLARLETDLVPMRQRANAWAVGDVKTLRALPYVDSQGACQDAFLSAAVVKQRGMADLPARIEAVWLAQAERVLAEHTNSFAVLPMKELLDEQGYVAKLRAKGYLVESGD
jgi:hypothetical protein